MRLGCVLLGACGFVVSARALAQSAPPAVSQVLVDPKDERHLAARSNFGLLLSRDAGASWDFRCKAGMGYQGRTEPPLAILNGGALVLGLPTGISTGDPAGCDFEPATGIQANVVDVAALTETPGAALAVSASFADSTSRVWKSVDGGRSFRALGGALSHFTALSLGVPVSSPNRVYLTGLLWAEAVAGAFAVSNDGGKTFAITALPNTDSGAQPFVAGVDPKRPDTVYVRLTGMPGRLRVTNDAGRTFREVLSIPGPLQGVALSPASDQVFASSLEAGTYRADAASLKFEQVACGGLPCLTTSGATLLACGERSRNGFVVGRSVDGGRSFGALLDTPCLAPAKCGANTTVGKTCARDWPRVSALIGQAGTTCDRAAPSKPFSQACFADAGTATVSASASAVPAKPSAAPSAPSAPNAAQARRPSAGCGCALPRTGAAHSTLPLLALLLAAARLRARKRAPPTAA